VQYLLEAFRSLDPSRFALTLAGRVVGEGRGLAAYDGLFRHATGLRRLDMPALYREHDVFVLPSLAEGSAYVVYEAMASGLPVVVTPNAGADLVREGVEGFVVAIRSPAEIAARLEELAADPDGVARMGEAARARSVEFDWARFRATFADLLAKTEAER
jgi:glycosyltransferase involved in cell wall biosynthesis